MEKRKCIELNTVLSYDASLRMFIAYFDGDEERMITIAPDEQLKMKCDENSDVLFLFSCKEANICYAEKLRFDEDGYGSILSIVDKFKIVYEDKANFVDLAKLIPVDLVLYEKGFVIMNGEKKESFGVVPTI